MKPSGEKSPKPEGSPERKASKGGRPAKVDTLKKTKRLYLHVTSKEAKAFEDAYQVVRLTTKISRNEFLKRNLLRLVSTDGQPQKAISIQENSIGNRLDQSIKLLNQLVIQLKGIGNNYNQSVKSLNNIYLSNEVKKEILSQSDLLTQIYKLLNWSEQQFKQAKLFNDDLNP